MGRKKVKPSVYLTEMTTSQLKELVSYLDDRASEMEMDEEFLEESGENFLPLLRGLISFLREEHLEEEEPEELDLYEDDVEDEEDLVEEEEDDELEF